MTRKIKGLILALALIAAVPIGSYAVGSAVSPSAPLGTDKVTRNAKVGGNSLPMTSDVYGWQVFTINNKVAVAQQVLDNQGNAPKSGILHMYCRGTAGGPVGGGVVGDSKSTDTLTTTPGGLELGPVLTSSLTAWTSDATKVCTPILDVQFIHGLVGYTADSAPLYIYWSPAIGGSLGAPNY